MKGTADISIEVLVDGSPLREYRDANGTTWVAAKPGDRFTIRVKNDRFFHGRILAVVTVDGKNVVNGSDGSVRGSGYIIDANSAINIDGWRRGNETAAAFVFTDPRESYIAQMGQGTTNCGVIAAAVFSERKQPEILRDYGTMRGFGFDRPQTMSLGNTRSAGPSLGTGYGEEIVSRVRQASFDRSEQPAEILMIRYGTEVELRAHGIIVDAPPNPFPADTPAPAPTVPAPPYWPQGMRPKGTRS